MRNLSVMEQKQVVGGEVLYVKYWDYRDHSYIDRVRFGNGRESEAYAFANELAQQNYHVKINNQDGVTVWDSEWFY